MIRPVVALHYNLIQDVAVLQPVARLAGETGAEIQFLVSPNFTALDHAGKWRPEIERLAAEVSARIITYESLFDIVRIMASRSGICIAGSESDVPAHHGSHDLFRVMPSGIRTATLQHGYECVGFLHNARHSAVLGRDVRFASDIIVGWFDGRRLSDIAGSERSKLFVAGPTILINPPNRNGATAFDANVAMVCENTHSVRFASKGLKDSFIEQTEGLAARMHAIGRSIDFRPHPAARFIERTSYALKPGMRLCDAPLYTLDLAHYAFALSAPSTVLFDFMLADVPVACWTGQSLDDGNYAGMLSVDGIEACWTFAAAAIAARPQILENQRRFLAGLGVPDHVPDRYRALLALASG